MLATLFLNFRLFVGIIHYTNKRSKSKYNSEFRTYLTLNFRLYLLICDVNSEFLFLSGNFQRYVGIMHFVEIKREINNSGLLSTYSQNLRDEAGNSEIKISRWTRTFRVKVGIINKIKIHSGHSTLFYKSAGLGHTIYNKWSQITRRKQHFFCYVFCGQ